MPRENVIFVNDRAYRVWPEASPFRSRDLIAGFDPQYFSDLADMFRPELNGKREKTAALGIRTVYGLAVEAFFSLLFATLQAPHAPVAWLLLYKPGDIRVLIEKFETGKDLPSKIVPKEPGSWKALANMLIPLATSDQDGTHIVDQLGELWQRLAHEFVDETVSAEFNSLKHGFRARPASPWLSIGGHEFTGADHGSWFPMLACQGKDVIVNFGTHSWSAEQLCAVLKLITASLTNILALLKNFHGETLGRLILEVPDQEEFDTARPVAKPLKSFRLSTKLDINLLPPMLSKEEALRAYKQISGPLEVRQAPEPEENA
jgi:hypothetical protein